MVSAILVTVLAGVSLAVVTATAAVLVATSPAAAADQPSTVVAFGDAGVLGATHVTDATGGIGITHDVVGMAAAPTGQGYWEVAADGEIFTFGSAQSNGTMQDNDLNAPVVGMAATPTGQGYWEVAADGGVFSFGAAQFYGSMGGEQNASPIVSMTAVPTGGGYWLLPAPYTLSPGRSILSPATTPPVVAECSEELTHYEDATFRPLTCDGGLYLNVLAWNRSANVSPDVLGLGPTATTAQLDTALCNDVRNHSSFPLEIEAYQLLVMYTGQSFGLDVSSVFSTLEHC